MHIELLTTAGCSICEKGLDIVLATGALSGAQLTTVDIADDPALVATYGASIPVLRCGDAELRWPFDGAAVAAWATRCRAR